MNPRVLFAEDDLSIRESFTAILNQEGIAVTPCASATEACERLATGNYDLVITDMRMETPTAGWNVIRAARALPHPPNVAVMTAFPIPKSDLRNYHIQAILNKGMPTSGLIAKVRELVRKAVARRAPHGKNDEGHDHVANNT
jgi:CheY-like chemotaxis protein